jgi:uncharacterized protein (TIGR02444 family)
MTPAPRETATGETFWRFSLALYARAGVAAALIALQDRAGRDVNLILYALWLGVRGVRLDAAALAAAAAAIAPINADAVAPLRRLRRQLRGTDEPQLATLRRRILGLELAAERQVQSRLAMESPSAKSEPEGERLGIAAANLALYLGRADREPEAAVVLEALRELTRR